MEIHLHTIKLKSFLFVFWFCFNSIVPLKLSDIALCVLVCFLHTHTHQTLQFRGVCSKTPTVNHTDQQGGTLTCRPKDQLATTWKPRVTRVKCAISDWLANVLQAVADTCSDESGYKKLHGAAQKTVLWLLWLVADSGVACGLHETHQLWKVQKWSLHLRWISGLHHISLKVF